MSQLSSSVGLPSGSIRAGFETAARTHAAANARTDAGAHPAARNAIAQPGSAVETAIANAARRTTIDFNYLLAQAKVESDLNPSARAATSSATGLYQFIDNTWLDTVRKHGERFGLGPLADDITVTASGSAQVADPARRAAILALRNDPQAAALMAAGLAEDNRAHLAPILGRQPSHAELYLAHFLGAGGAGRFLSELQADPGQSAPALFARPAAANRAIFYRADGSPRSLAQVMEVIGGKLDRALAPTGKAPAGPAAQASAAYPLAGANPFGPGQPPALRDTALSAPRLALHRAPQGLPQGLPMSQVLGMTFGTDPVAVPAQVRRAYHALKAFGL